MKLFRHCYVIPSMSWRWSISKKANVCGGDPWGPFAVGRIINIGPITVGVFFPLYGGQPKQREIEASLAVSQGQPETVAVGEDANDAVRYRWLRISANISWNGWITYENLMATDAEREEMDRAIDAAIANDQQAEKAGEK